MTQHLTCFESQFGYFNQFDSKSFNDNRQTKLKTCKLCKISLTNDTMYSENHCEETHRINVCKNCIKQYLAEHYSRKHTFPTCKHEVECGGMFYPCNLIFGSELHFDLNKKIIY